jgi:hypothetical protein
MISRTRKTSRRCVVLVAVAFAIGLSAPSLVAGTPNPKSYKGSNARPVAEAYRTLEIVEGLSQPETDESHASPFVPPGHAKHDGPDAPPGHAKHHREGGPPGHNKDRDKKNKKN